VARQFAEQPIDRGGGHDRVAVQQEQVGAGARADADVVGAREPDVRAGFDHADVRPSPGHGDAAIGRSVVDHEDFVARRRRRVMERLEAALEIRPRVERHDDD